MEHYILETESIHTQNSHLSSKITNVNQYYDKVRLKAKFSILMTNVNKKLSVTMERA